jgi:hypothetical protein
MKYSKIIASTALLVAAHTSFADVYQSELREQLDNLFLQDKIDRIQESDLSIREDLGESWINNSQQYEVGVIKEAVDQLGKLMLGTYVIDNSSTLITGVSEEITSGRQDYRILRDAHPKGHQCVNASFEVESNTLFPVGTFLGDTENHDAVIRFSSASNTPQVDSINDVRGGAIKVSVGEDTHDFVMLTSQTFPTDDAEQFTNLVKVARVANCIDIIPSNENNNGGLLSSIFGPIYDFNQKLLAAAQCVSNAELSIFDLPGIVGAGIRFIGLQSSSEIESVFDKSFFGVSPYAYNDTVFKFEMTKTDCDVVNTENLSLSTQEAAEDKGLENNIQRVLSSGNACYNLNAFTRPSDLSDREAIETHTKTWDDMSYKTIERIKVAKVVISQTTPSTQISQLACDDMQFNPGNTTDGIKPLGSLNRARDIVYRSLSDFRIDTNQYLRQQ